MSQVLYRKWRPGAFRHVVGQPTTTQTLRRAVESGRLSHAYLFCGPRGTGKTSTARILAKAMNCLSPSGGEPDNSCSICASIDAGRAMDLVEIDAASNRGIDDIRNLRERVQYTPAEARIKVYIVDEAHMLTEQAFNALLKTLEEPPAHVAFVLATTESHKIPPTIASRCQRFDFRRITRQDIAGRLAEISAAESVEVEPAALDLVSRAAGGGLRDAVNLLEQAIVSYDAPVTEENVRDMLDMGGDEASMALAAQVLGGRTADALRTVNEVAAQGSDLRQLQRGLVDRLRAVMLVSSGAELEAGYGDEEVAQMRSLAGASDAGAIAGAIRRMTAADLRGDPSSTLPLELAIVEVGLEPAPRPAARPEPAPEPARPARPAARAGPAARPETAPAPGRPPGAATPAGPAPQPAPAGPEPAQRRPPPAPVADADLPADPQARLEVQWNALAESLRHVKGDKFNLKALLSASNGREVAGGVITLRFPHPSHADRMLHELGVAQSKRIVEDAFERAMGGRYDVRVEAADREGPGSRAPGPGDSQLVRAARAMGAELAGKDVPPAPESEAQR